LELGKKPKNDGKKHVEHDEQHHWQNTLHDDGSKRIYPGERLYIRK
jgi:hypothetical protein